MNENQANAKTTAVPGLTTSFRLRQPYERVLVVNSLVLHPIPMTCNRSHRISKVIINAFPRST